MKMLQINEALYDYMIAMSSAEHPLLLQLRAETAEMIHAGMQIPAEQGMFMGLLAQCIGARKTLELGVFTGYSTLAMALALPDFGHITACDVDEAVTNVAKRYWQEAGVAQKIDLRLAPASDTLQSLLREGAGGSYDLAFIDADKLQYDAYYEQCLELVRPGGIILLDNVLWQGAVIDEAIQDAETCALRDLNKKIAQDTRVRACMLPLSDGLTVVRRHV